MDEKEKQSKINAYINLLQQNDYTARKVVFEVAKLFKEKFPETIMPEYEKYLETETKAEEFRQAMDELINNRLSPL